jgi:hypothetical protein
LEVELHACAGDRDAELCHSCPRELGPQIGEAIIEQEGVLLIILSIVALCKCAAIFRRELVGIIKVVSQVNVHLNHGADIDHKITCDYSLGVLTREHFRDLTGLINLNLETSPRRQVGRVDVVGPVDIGHE